MTMAMALDLVAGLYLPLTGIFMKLFQASRPILGLSAGLSQALLPSSHRHGL